VTTGRRGGAHGYNPGATVIAGKRLAAQPGGNMSFDCETFSARNARAARIGGAARTGGAVRIGGAALALALAAALSALLPAPARALAPEPAAAARGSSGDAAANAGGGAAAGGGEEREQAPLDAVVQEVVRMLQAKVAEPVVVHWLETSGRRPAALGSREIVELERAGASDPLMTRLLDLAASQARRHQPAAGGAPEATSPPAASAGAGKAAPSPEAATTGPVVVAPPAAKAGAAGPPARAAGSASAPPPSATAASTPVGADMAVASRAATPGAAPVHWRIAYHPNFGPDDERWDLYVYLDGHYLAWVKSPVVSLFDPPVEFDRPLAPGHHVLRVVEERHLRNLGRSGWSHEARVAPAVLAFDLAPDAAGRVELSCEAGQRGGPLRLRVVQGAETADARPKIGQPDVWPLLCEEASTGRSPLRRALRAGAREPASCLRWTDLWPGIQSAPSRDAVRAELAQHDFHPDPARSGE
jgi:hypothetical protein